MRSRIILILSGVVLLGGSIVFAGSKSDKEWSMHCKKGDSGHWGKESSKIDIQDHFWVGIADKLNLTDEQKEKIREQKHKTAREHIKTGSELKLKMLDLKYELDRDEINDKKVDGLVDEISEIQKQILKNKINSLKEMKSVFTKKQWKKMRDLKKMKGQYNKKKFYKGKKKYK